MASDDRTDALLPSGRSEALDRLRAQLDGGSVETGRRAARRREPRAVAHWEGGHRAGSSQRGRALPPGRDPSDAARPAPRPPDMQAFIRRQVLGRAAACSGDRKRRSSPTVTWTASADSRRVRPRTPRRRARCSSARSRSASLRTQVPGLLGAALMNLGLGLGHRLGGSLRSARSIICLVVLNGSARGIIDHRQPR